VLGRSCCCCRVMPTSRACATACVDLVGGQVEGRLAHLELLKVVGACGARLSHRPARPAASMRERARLVRRMACVCGARVQEVAHRRLTRRRGVPNKQSMLERPTQAAAVQCGRWRIRWPTHVEAREHTCVQTPIAMRVATSLQSV